MKILIKTSSSYEETMKNKPRYNCHAYGYGEIIDKKTKRLNRKSKASQKEKQSYIKYIY